MKEPKMLWDVFIEDYIWGKAAHKGREAQLHGQEFWPTLHIWYPDHNNPGEAQKSSKLIEHLVMA